MKRTIASSFGLMEFGTTADDPQATYGIVSIDNEGIDSRTLKSSQLSFSAQNTRKK